MISARIHSSGGEVILAACDADLLGKEFREGRRRLLVSRDFYEGMEVTPQKFLEMLESSTIANITGREAVDVAVEGGFVNPDCVIYIDGVPHAQMAVYEGR